LTCDELDWSVVHVIVAEELVTPEAVTTEITGAGEAVPVVAKL
jgi:hypothetical protein